MTKFLLAVIAILTIGASVANAAIQHRPVQQGDGYNWMEGGGG